MYSLNENMQVFEEILKELQNITLELKLLREELNRIYNRSNEKVISASQELNARDDNKYEEQNSLAVYDWLTSRNIVVKNYHEQDSTDKIIDELALFIGERFKNVFRLHELIRKNLSTGDTFALNLSSSSQTEVGDSTNLCNKLYSYAFLSSYRYAKSSKMIYASVQRNGKVINFFTGGWFERYVYQKISDLLIKSKLKFTHLANPQIILPSGDDFELDLLFLIENQPLWVECKTGEYQAYVQKYSNVRKILNIPKNRSVLIILGISDDIAEKLTELYDITITNETKFMDLIRLLVLNIEQSCSDL